MLHAVSNLSSKLVCLAVVALCGVVICEGVISVPLTGYQQGIKLQITPPGIAGEQCYVYGVPTPFGTAPEGPTPLSVYTYKNTGSHVIEFEYKSSDYELAPVFVPGDTIIQVDTSNPSRPLIKFDSNQSPQGKYAYINVQLLDNNKQSLCVSNIALVVEAPLSCLPTWGGYYDTINPIGPSVLIPSFGGGQIVVPGGNVYAPTYVQNTIIQQFITVNNVNINNINIINNVVAITNVTIIRNVTAPPTPAPVNCTTTPTAPACQARQPPRIAPSPGTTTTTPNTTRVAPASGPVRQEPLFFPGPVGVVVNPPSVATRVPPTTSPTNQSTVQTVQPPASTARAPTSTITTGRRLRA